MIYSGPLASSSVQISSSSATKSLDMSMPSYGTISSPKLSSEDFATLSVTEVKQQEVSPPKKKEAKSESESGSPFDAFLPSINKKGPEEAAAEKAAAKKAAASKAAVKKAAAVPTVKAPTYDF
jgi:hypothetical protein